MECVQHCSLPEHIDDIFFCRHLNLRIQLFLFVSFKLRISLIRNGDKIPSQDHLIVQEYIEKPFLMEGYKFDLRIYILVTSCDPLKIFLYHDGLVRMGTEKYIPPNESNLVSHTRERRHRSFVQCLPLSHVMCKGCMSPRSFPEEPMGGGITHVSKSASHGQLCGNQTECPISQLGKDALGFVLCACVSMQGPLWKLLR